MEVRATLAMLYAQTNFAARAVHDASTGPQASLAMSREIANEMAKLENQQVQAPDPSVEARVTDEENAHSKGQFAHQKNSNSAEEKEEETSSDENNATVGNLLNIKV